MGSRYSSLKVFRFPAKLASLPRANPAILPPLHVRVKPTNACNHACSYCAYRAPGLQLGQDMDVRDEIPREKMLEIVDDLVALGVGAVTFSGGGEPLLYPHLAAALDRLAGSAVRFAALTNGALLEGGVAERFARRGSWVRVSIDGWDGPSYAEYRGCPADEFDRVLGNLRRFKALGGPCALGVAIVVDGRNAPHLGGLIDRLAGLGVDAVKVSPCVTRNDGAEDARGREAFVARAREEVRAAARRHEGSGIEISDAFAGRPEDYAKPYRSCPFLQILPVIGADLNVYACQDKAYNLDTGLLGSIRDARFRDFWFADKGRFFAVDPSRDCDHHCVADAKNRLVHEWLGLDPDHLAFV